MMPAALGQRFGAVSIVSVTRGKPSWKFMTICECGEEKEMTWRGLKGKVFKCDHRPALVSHWKVPRGMDIDTVRYIGFIYAVTGPDGRKYIGKRHYRTIRGRNKGKPRPGWETYTGSSKELNRDIERLGKRNFRFEIIEQYETWQGLNWAEVYTQAILKVPERSAYYNKFIDSVRGKSREMVTLRNENWISLQRP